MDWNFSRGVMCTFLTGVGIAGNIFVLTSYALTLAGTERTCVRLTLIHLSFSHIIMLLCKGLPKTVAAFVARNGLDDTSCKVIVYLQRVARGLSICTSSLLSVGQAIAMSPRRSGWRRLQPRSAWLLLPLLLVFWILNCAIGMNLLYYVKSFSTNTTELTSIDGFCDFQPKNPQIRWLFLALMVLRDTVFQSVMGGASVYIVLVLHKHHQRVLHLQRSKCLYKTPPEIKAAQSVLLLMLCFLLSYWIEYILSLFLNSFLKGNVIIHNIRELLPFAYLSLSPFLLIHRDGHLRACGRGP